MHVPKSQLSSSQIHIIIHNTLSSLTLPLPPSISKPILSFSLCGLLSVHEIQTQRKSRRRRRRRRSSSSPIENPISAPIRNEIRRRHQSHAQPAQRRLRAQEVRFLLCYYFSLTRPLGFVIRRHLLRFDHSEFSEAELILLQCLRSWRFGAVLVWFFGVRLLVH